MESVKLHSVFYSSPNLSVLLLLITSCGTTVHAIAEDMARMMHQGINFQPVDPELGPPIRPEMAANNDVFVFPSMQMNMLTLVSV